MWLEPLLRRYPRLKRLPPGCFVVGGAIRDLLMGAEPADVDVAAPDAEDAAAKLGGRIVVLGRGALIAIRVVAGQKIYDIAALQGATIQQDLGRRDCTLNAMAVDLVDGRLIDPFEGSGDLSRRLVRMVSAANFDHDPLRCLKVVRMAVRLGFEIEPLTMDAVVARVASIESVSVERVTYEMLLIFGARRFRRAVELLHRCGFDVVLFGRPLESSAYLSDDVSLAGSFALLVGDPLSYARHWRWSDALLFEVTSLQRLMKGFDDLALFEAGEQIASQLPGVFRAMGREEEAEQVERVLDSERFDMRPLLSGEEICELTGVPPGPSIGRMKRELLRAQLSGAINGREDAEVFVRGLTSSA